MEDEEDADAVFAEGHLAQSTEGVLFIGGEVGGAEGRPEVEGWCAHAEGEGVVVVEGVDCYR